MTSRNGLRNLEVCREVSDVLGRYGILARYQRTIGNSHILLSVMEKGDTNRMVDNLRQPSWRHLHRVSKKELSTGDAHQVTRLQIATMLDIGDP